MRADLDPDDIGDVQCTIHGRSPSLFIGTGEEEQPTVYCFKCYRDHLQEALPGSVQKVFPSDSGGEGDQVEVHPETFQKIRNVVQAAIDAAPHVDHPTHGPNLEAHLERLRADPNVTFEDVG